MIDFVAANLTAAVTLVLTPDGGAIAAGKGVVIGLQSGDTGALADLAPQGFTQVAGSPINTTSHTKMWMWYKVAGASEPTSYSITEGTGLRTLRGFVAALSGIDTAALLHRSSVLVANTQVVSPWPLDSAAYGSATSATVDEFFWGGSELDFSTTTTHVPPSGFTESIDYGPSDTIALTLATRNAVAAGATGAYTATATGAASRNARRAVIALAITAPGVDVDGASSQTLAVTGAATGTVGSTEITGTSSAAVPLTGTASGTVDIVGASTAAVPITGVASGTADVAGASARTIAIGGAATGTVEDPFIAGVSERALVIGGTAAGTVEVTGSNDRVLTMGGTASGTNDNPVPAPAPSSGTGGTVIVYTGPDRTPRAEPARVTIRPELARQIGAAAGMVEPAPLTSEVPDAPATGREGRADAAAPAIDIGREAVPVSADATSSDAVVDDAGVRGSDGEADSGSGADRGGSGDGEGRDGTVAEDRRVVQTAPLTPAQVDAILRDERDLRDIVAALVGSGAL